MIDFVKISLCLVFLSTSVGRQAVFSQTLPEYLGIAIKNNPSMQADYQAYLAAVEQVKQVSALTDPQLSLGYFVNPIETRVGPQRGRFSIRQPLPWWGETGARRTVAVQQAEKQLAQFLMARKQVVLQVKTAYYVLYTTFQDIALTQKNIEILTFYERLATQKYENNLATMVDILRVQMQVREEQHKLKSLQQQVIAQRTVFNKLLNRPADAAVEIDSSMQKSLGATDSLLWQQKMIANHPLLTISKAERALKAEQINIARLNNKPNIGVGLDYALIGQRNGFEVENNGRDAIMPMISFTLPIFNQKRNDAVVRQAQLLDEGAEQARLATENQLITKLSQAVSAYQVAKDKVQLYQDQVKSVQQAISISISVYQANSQNLEDVLEFQQRLLKYQMALNQAKLQLQIVLAQIEELTEENEYNEEY